MSTIPPSTLSATHLLPIVASICVAYWTSLVIYRLYFHPLAKFPGPKYAAISRWHEFYYEVVQEGKFIWKIEEYHKKYGPIVRIVPDELHIQDSSFYDTIYTKAGRVDKYDWTLGRFNAPNSSFSTLSADLHALRRGALNPLFSRQRIIEFEVVIREKVNQFIRRIRKFKELKQPFPLSSGFHALAGDVIMQYCFSLNYDHIESENFETNLHEPFLAGSRASHMSLQFPIVPKILFSLPESWMEKIEPIFHLFFQLRKDINRQIVTLKEGRGEGFKKTVPPTILQELLDNPNLPESEKEPDRLQDEAQTILGGGITTASWSMAVGSYHIITNPEIYSKLRNELIEAIPDPEAELKWVNLEKLPYLSGCIRESVRLAYPVCARSPRVSSNPIQYKQWIIPPRTPVSMTLVDISKDEEIFPQNQEFRPERWMNSPKTKDGESLDRYFVSFQKGSRSCVGINLGFAELYHAMAAVHRNFKFEIYNTDISDVTVVHDFFIASPRLDSKGVWVKCIPES